MATGNQIWMKALFAVVSLLVTVVGVLVWSMVEDIQADVKHVKDDVNNIRIQLSTAAGELKQRDMTDSLLIEMVRDHELRIRTLEGQ